MGTTDDKEKLLQLQAFCGGITEERAEELLDASNGSLERAVDIFFHQQQQIEASISSDNPPPPLDTKEQVKPVNSPTRSTTTRPRKKVDKNQAKLDSFFQAESSDKSSNPGVDDHVVEDGGASSKVINVDDSEEDEPAIDLNSAPAVNNLKTEDISIDQEIVGFPSTSSLPPNAISSPKREALPSLSPPLKKPRSNMASKSTGLETEPIKHQVSFLRLSECLQQMADTTKRLVKLDVLQALIQDIIEHADESERGYVLTCALQLVLGRRSSIDHAPMEVSGSAVSKALQTMLGVSRAQLSKGYRATGDLGDSAASLFQKKTFFVTKIRPLSIVQLYESLEKIVTAEGRDSKQHILLQLLRKCQTKSELRFQVRLLIGNMRIGCNLKTVLAALAMALVPEKDSVSVKKNAVALVQKTHDMCPSLDKIVDALLVGGLEKMKKDCTIQVLTPIAPMLANPAHSLEEADKIMSGENSSSVLEWKYDGVRCQAHWDGTTLKLFSRHMLETTAQYPDAAASFLQALSDDVTITSFILDSEIVGVEGEGDNLRLLPFQDLSRRKKKNDDGKGVQIKVFAFDLMYLNGISYTNRPLWERQQVLYEHFQETSGFSFVSSLTLTRFDEPTIRGFLEEAVRGGAEGLMLKLLGKAATVANVNGDPELAESTHVPSVTTLATCQYEAGTRSQSWLKIKRDYVAGYADTIDVVPIGAWYGSGRKAQKNFLSPVLFAVYDEDEDVYRSISRCMSFTDNMYDAMREFYFRGTPYPPGVGVGEGETGGLVSVEEEMDTRDDSGSDDDNAIPTNEDADPDGNTDGRVNCYSSRPSSAIVITHESPPIWFRPMEVFEVSFADMSISRKHTAAAGLIDDPEGRGVALRFPRFKRRRPDKRIDQATTSLQIAQLFAKQSKQGATKSQGR